MNHKEERREREEKHQEEKTKIEERQREEEELRRKKQMEEEARTEGIRTLSFSSVIHREGSADDFLGIISLLKKKDVLCRPDICHSFSTMYFWGHFFSA